jgi:phage/plasmid-associated DNA primase
MLKTELDKLTIFQKDIQNLRQVKYRDNLIKDVLNKINDETVEFDKNPLLYSFNNKIFDLRRDIFIESHYTQYISMTAGYDYNDRYDATLTTNLEALFDTIFSITEVKAHYLERCSTGLCGLHIQNFNIAQGGGGNGKSVINSLLIKTLGNYAYKLPSSVLLQEIKEGGNPQVANMHKKRFVLVQEPNGNRKICCATMKEITGDKSINVRLLHSNKCGITLELTLMMECNELPLLDEVEEAEVRRINVSPFMSKFVSQDRYNELECKTNVFIGNSFYATDEFQEINKQAMFELLRKYFKKYVANGFEFSPTPEVCKSKTRDYLAVSDDIYEWVRSTYTYVDDISIYTAPVYLSDMFLQFKNSDLFRSMSKAQQRKYSKSHFEDKIKNNLFLLNDFVDRKGYINGVQLSKPALKNWKMEI